MTRTLATLVIALALTACAAVEAPAVSVEQTPSSTIEPSATAIATAAAIESASTTPGQAADLQVAWAEQAFEGSVGAVAADGSQFVAVGGTDDGLAAWTSPDGIAWQQEPVPDATDLGESDIDLTRGAALGQLVRLGDTLYSFGGLSFNDYIRPTAWRHTDGESWRYIESDSEFFSYGWVDDMTAGDGALLAATHGASYYTASTWLWTPATSWIRSGLASNAARQIEIIDTAWSESTYVAVGVRAEPNEDVGAWEWPTTPMVWTSTDGQTWTDAAVSTEMGTPCSVHARPEGGFIGLAIANGEVRAWMSPTGSSWTHSDALTAPSLPTPATFSSYICDTVAVDGGLLALVGTEVGTLTWTSADGELWTSGETLPIFASSDAVAVLGGDVVLFGTRGTMGDDATEPLLMRGTIQH